MKSFLCEIFFACLVAAPGASSLDDLTYGTALYAYYQRDYEQALLQVMVARRRGLTGEDSLRFDLARGSFAFQEGMYRFASDTFDAVADDELTDLDRMRLAFHLAREYYRRGDWTGAEGQLARIDLGANWRGRQRRHPEVSFMTAEAAMARGDFPAARAALEYLPPDSEYFRAGRPAPAEPGGSRGSGTPGRLP